MSELAGGANGSAQGGGRPLPLRPDPARDRVADVSVVVPVLDEEAWLPALLDTIAAQTVRPREVLVVDAGSRDRTRAFARERGALVLEGGGHPGVSRNYGAEWAEGEWLLFLDADVRLPPTAVEEILSATARDGLDAASCAFVPDREGRAIRLQHWLSSTYFWASSKIGWAHSIGAFLFVRRSLHERIGGFDHAIKVAEDQDYVVRLSKVGRYAFCRSPVVEIATRRFDREGLVGQSAKWIGIEAHRIFVGEIRGNYFRYFK